MGTEAAPLRHATIPTSWCPPTFHRKGKSAGAPYNSRRLASPRFALIRIRIGGIAHGDSKTRRVAHRHGTRGRPVHFTRTTFSVLPAVAGFCVSGPQTMSRQCRGCFGIMRAGCNPTVPGVEAEAAHKRDAAFRNLVTGGSASSTHGLSVCAKAARSAAVIPRFLKAEPPDARYR